MEINDVVYVNNFGVSKVVDINDETVCIAPIYGTNKGTIMMNKFSKNIRKVYTKEEIDKVIIEVNLAQTNWINKFVDRASEYSKIKANPSPLSRFVMIKTIYNQYKYKKDNKIKGGLASRDLDFYHKSLSLISNEFCLALKMSLDQLKTYISTIWNNNLIYEYFKI